MADPKRPAAKKRRRPAHPTPKPKPIARTKDRAKVEDDQVSLVIADPKPKKGDGPGGEYWEVQVEGRRVGEVFVNVIEEAPIGRHASLQIYLNRTEQAKGIGRVAYRKAADASGHEVIYLHMRKNNLASRIAAEAAGFRDVSPAEIIQLILKREKHSA